MKADRRILARSPADPARGVLLTAATNVLLVGLTAVTGALAARLLGPEGRGELAAIQLVPSVIATVAMLGMPEALVFYSAREPDRAGRLLGSSVAMTMISAIPFAVLGFVVMPYLLHAQSAAVVQSARWYLFIIPVFALVAMPLQPLRGQHDFAVWNALRLPPTLVWLCVLLVAASLGARTPGFVAAAYLVCLASLVVPVLAVVRWRIPPPYDADVRDWPRLLRYGIPAAVTTVPNLLNLKLDQMMMAALLPTRSLGLYAVAVSWSGALNPLISALGSVLFPHVASRASPEERSDAVRSGVRVATSLAVGLGIVLAVATPLGMVLLFGQSFRSAIPAAVVLVVAAAVSSLSGVLAEGMRGLGTPAAVLRAETLGLVGTTGTLVVLLGPLEIMGAALASLVGYSIVAFVLLVEARRVTGYSAIDLIRPTKRDLHVAMSRLRGAIVHKANGRER